MIFMLNTHNIWDDIYNHCHMMLAEKTEAENNNWMTYPAYGNFVLVPDIIKPGENEEYISTPLTNDDADEYNLKYSEYRIKKAAEHNTKNLCPPMLVSLEDYLFGATPENNLLCDTSKHDIKTNEIFILTNQRDFHGASSLFEPGVIDHIHSIFHQGFIAIITQKDFCYIAPETLVEKDMLKLGENMSMLGSELEKHHNMLWFPENTTLYDNKLCSLYTLTDQEIKEHPFINAKGEASFYRFVIEHFCHYSYDEITSCDCTKIDVAQNIQNAWFEAEEERIKNEYRKKYNREPSEDAIKDGKTQFVMFLAMSGPKAMPELPDNTIRFSEDFVTP